MMRITWSMSSSVLVVGALAACHKAVPPPPPPVPVSVAEARRADIPIILQSTGTVEPIQTAAVQAQVSGQLLRVRFKEGDPVTEGETLFEIDPRPFEAALAQAQGPLSRDRSQWENAVHDLARYEALAAKDYIPQQQLDQARAAVVSLVGMLHSDSAAIEQAKLNLQYATIRAPITGRTGSIMVKEGNQIRGGVGQTLVVINQMSPILVRFPISADSFDAVRRRASQSLDVVATPVADSTHRENGKLIFLDNTVDSLTGTVALKGTFVNTDGALWPGTLVRVSLQLEVQHDALVVPASAVQSGQAGDVVWIVDSAQKARVKKVKVLRNTDSVAVLAGGIIAAGDHVIIDGQLRLTDGAKIAVRTPAQRRDSTTAGRGDSAATRPSSTP